MYGQSLQPGSPSVTTASQMGEADGEERETKKSDM